MQNYKLNMLIPSKISNLILLMITFVAMNFLVGCSSLGKENTGTTFITSRGSSPPAQAIVWSPTNEDKLLVTAYETPAEPAEVYILDIETKYKDVLAKQVPAYFFDAKWTPDGKGTIILAENNTKGFEPSGWWLMDTENKPPEYFMPSGDIAWSPDGKTIATLRKEKDTSSKVKIDLLLIDANSRTEDVISTFSEVDSSWGISWSADGNYVVFSLGDQAHSNLYIFNVRTREVAKITDNDGSKYPAWSPKGAIIAYTRNFAENTAKTYLYLTSSDGKCDVEIPDLENVWSPTWSPDGRKLGYVGRDGIYFVEIEKVLGRNIYEGLCE